MKKKTELSRGKNRQHIFAGERIFEANKRHFGGATHHRREAHFRGKGKAFPDFAGNVFRFSKERERIFEAVEEHRSEEVRELKNTNCISSAMQRLPRKNCTFAWKHR